MEYVYRLYRLYQGLRVCLSACEERAGDHQVIACGINRQESSTMALLRPIVSAWPTDMEESTVADGLSASVCVWVCGFVCSGGIMYYRDLCAIAWRWAIRATVGAPIGCIRGFDPHLPTKV